VPPVVEPTPIPTPTPAPAPEPEPEPRPRIISEPAPEPAPVAIPEPPAPVVEPPAPVSEPVPEPVPEPTPEPVPAPVEETPAPVVEPPVVEPPIAISDPEPVVEPHAPEPKPEPIPTPLPAPAPEPKPEPKPELAPEIKGLTPNNPSQLPVDVPKQAPVEILVPHIQEDKPGVENGGIQFFGTQSQPQVVQENGTLTPPPPLPGSGDPIPPDAITLEETFVGQPGGTTFNSPDVAVPVLPIEINIDVPGVGETVQALADAYVALANIGNDMSPITRKKAKKIIAATIVGGIIVRRIK
jgi:hypothetical protein